MLEVECLGLPRKSSSKLDPVPFRCPSASFSNGPIWGPPSSTFGWPTSWSILPSGPTIPALEAQCALGTASSSRLGTLILKTIQGEFCGESPALPVVELDLLAPQLKSLTGDPARAGFELDCTLLPVLPGASASEPMRLRHMDRCCSSMFEYSAKNTERRSLRDALDIAARPLTRVIRQSAYSRSVCPCNAASKEEERLCSSRTNVLQRTDLVLVPKTASLEKDAVRLTIRAAERE
mmetsp:Transcript_30776/g.94316  ORF Transcript_30776/g.94316 Transcript_30776/m.94316 type:complete len:236 (+) Transcript_30776:1538-2245(+)|eukprot:scaffold15779_cov31-Tisochrysis_lutea.AAC.2